MDSLENKNILDRVIGLLEQENYSIECNEIILSETKIFIDKISTEKFMNIKERPNYINLSEILNDYEKEIYTLIQIIIYIGNYGKERYNETIIDVIKRILNMKKNDKDEFGYIWRHISNYPVLLITYAIGVFCFKYSNFKLLYKIFNLPIKQRDSSQFNIEYVTTSLIDAINCYHVFNNIDNISVDISQHLSKIINDNNITRVLQANQRVNEFLLPKMSLFLDFEYDDYFDLYEFFVGLDIMSKRIKRDWLYFAPYGIRYWKYSQSGRYYYGYKDSKVRQFIDDVLANKNEVLNIGFFDGNPRNFEIALGEYLKLLQRLYR
jgi:hypothetical protein